MNNDDFDTFDESSDTEYGDNESSKQNPKRQNKRQQLEDLLEEKRLRSELDEYDYQLSQKRSYYDDDLFSDYYSKEGDDHE